MTWPRAPRTARRPLSQDLIVDAALDLLAKGNLESVSMRRVAQELGTGAASLYAHVGNKDELHELMLDRLLGTIPVPAPDPTRWREQLKDVARAQLAVLTSYPGIARIGMETTVPTGPNALRHGESLLGLLRAGGLPDRVAAVAFDTLTLWASAFAVEVSATRTGEVDPAEVANRGEQIGAYMAAHPREFANLLSLGPTLMTTSVEDRFEFGLDVFLAGLTALAAKP
ncbi:TetR/AcrR family transcriptional regulator [Actinophytocola sp.]|jgi:AcrR family transcriptional regulator|uniref:TetR/AcrR family transcriptional regulator n=1 Tax=Actinophytocola sp. TaxID=1872138 RepID=UPI002ED9AB68